MQSFLDRDQPQRLFKRKCTDLMRVEEFYVDFVIFNKRSSSFIEGPASWPDRQTVQNHSSVIIYISNIHQLRSDFYFLSFNDSSLFLWNDSFFLREQFGPPSPKPWHPPPPLPPCAYFLVFMKSYKYRHLLTMNSTGDLCQQLFLLVNFRLISDPLVC